MAWIWLIIGGLFEVGFTTSLRFVDGFRNVPWTLAFHGSVSVSMGMLEIASRLIPIGTAYAVWGGAGIALIVIAGAVLFNEMPYLPAIIGVGLIVVGAVIVNTMSLTIAH